jgi:Sigma-70 region 2
MDESTNQGEAFEHYRVLLFSIAYRMTGSASEAEGLMQETSCMRRTGNAESQHFTGGNCMIILRMSCLGNPGSVFEARIFIRILPSECWDLHQQAKLVWGKQLYFDSTQVHANADLDSLAPRFAVEARAAIREHLGALFPPEPAPSEHAEESSMDAPLLEQRPQDAFGPKPAPLPVVISEAQREELAADNATRHDWIAEEGQQQREVHGSRPSFF